ncbi:MAG: carbohydrate ABC transporter substrate-binding protein [Ruminococcaceae bacterium]|nr:carbohydrate ABC transporter substrate-binding protein [Oscillospiraceae bacterium]
MKKILSIALVAVMVLGLFAGCNTANNNTGNGSGEVTIKVAAIETAYGSEMWKKVCDAFTAETGIKVELTTDKKLEEVIGPQIQAGKYPDVVHLATGRPAALTEQLIKANGLHELTNVLNMKVPGEDKKVSDKIAGGFTDTSLTNPYADGKTYMAPMFYSPCGLFYNAKLFEAKGWKVPATWDEMWELGEKAKAEGIALFTYPTAGYYDAFMYALMYSVGGTEFFEKATHYAEGVWDTPEAQKMFEILDKLAKYTHEKTPAQANNQDFTKNQLMVMKDEALFMPNGTWIVGEMAEAQKTLTNEFAWGMTALPAVSADGSGYSYTWFEQAWIPAGSAHKAEAEQFVAFLYSDKAVEIFAAAGAMQPVLGIADKLEGDNKLFYSIYDNGAKAAMGNFAAFNAIPDVEVSKVFFEPIDKLVAGSLTIEQYIANIKTASDLMRANLKA